MPHLLKQIAQLDLEIKAWMETCSPIHLTLKRGWYRDSLISVPPLNAPLAAFIIFKNQCLDDLRIKRSKLQVELDLQGEEDGSATT